jgi:hypothetical protein
MGCCEPLVPWSLQGKKSPNRRFFDIFCAKRNKLLPAVYIFAIFLGGFYVEGQELAGQTETARQEKRAPGNVENPVDFIGMSVTELFENFGPPVAVYASRGIEPWQDDVVFEYSGVDFYIYKDKVWQLSLDSGRGINMGDPRAAVLLVLGETARDKNNYIVGRPRNTSWPLEWRFNIEGGKVSAIYLYRMDY